MSALVLLCKASWPPFNFLVGVREVNLFPQGACYIREKKNIYIYLDERRWNHTLARRINQSRSNPNCKIQILPDSDDTERKRTVAIIIAAKDIEAGTQLFWNYNAEDK